MNPFTLLSPGRWLLYGAFALALVIGAYALVDHIGDVREAKVVVRYAKQAKAVDEKRDAVAAPIAAKQEQQQEKIRTVFKTITKEIPVYVKATDCPLSGGFRVFHDAAANGEVPNPAAIADAVAVPAQDAASTIASNYETCHATAARLTGLQDWVKAQKEIK